MCGILGWLGNPDPNIARKALDRLTHRGPDQQGEWLDENRSIWLGHRRLSIIDVSPLGRQPMVSPSGRYVLCYNGEVYNYPALKKELENLRFQFKGTSDTEVVLAAIEAWGLRAALEKFIGMFAFGLYDREEACLWLVRDRMGIKPLYYAHNGAELVFSSELKPLKLIPWLDQSIDPVALDAYLRYLCVPAPLSILKGVRKLQPGELLRWNGSNLESSFYWSLNDAVENGRENPFTGSRQEAADELESLLRNAVSLRMVSDVPLGAFLSGGIDSSTVVALMQSQSSQKIKTFSIGFKEKAHDESRYAKKVAAHLGTDHRELILDPGSILEAFPKITTSFDEPFADLSSLPTYLVSQFAREHVTVTLSGDGGDELFGGYPRYFWAKRIQNFQRRVKPPLARVAGRLLQAIPAWFLDGPVSSLGGAKYGGSGGLSHRVHRMGKYIVCPPESVYKEIVAAWKKPEAVLKTFKGSWEMPSPLRFPELDWAQQMMAIDQTNYMVDDILTKVDRASMAVSLETRVPILDHRIVEWSWRIPLEYNLAAQGDRGKLLLRDVLYRHVPKELIERPKMGFGLPMEHWLRKELRPWAEDLLQPASLKNSGIFRPEPIQKVWEKHLQGENRLPEIWTALMFLEWQKGWSAQP